MIGEYQSIGSFLLHAEGGLLEVGEAHRNLLVHRVEVGHELTEIGAAELHDHAVVLATRVQHPEMAELLEEVRDGHPQGLARRANESVGDRVVIGVHRFEDVGIDRVLFGELRPGVVTPGLHVKISNGTVDQAVHESPSSSRNRVRGAKVRHSPTVGVDPRLGEGSGLDRPSV